MKLRLSIMLAVLVAGLAAVVAAASVSSQAATSKTGSGYTIPAGGTTTTGLPVTGTFTITTFKKVNGTIEALGTFTGSVNGGPTTTTTGWAPVTSVDGKSLTGGASTTAAAASGSCQILDLTLGPLHLDLLGLVVDLNQVHLQITAQQGSGNLLGNLLCAVANLLNNSGGSSLQNLLTNLTTLLNQILAGL